MKADVLGANCRPSAGPTDQIVLPAAGLPAESVQANAVPPQSWTSIPRCFRYHSPSALGSLALMKMPPMPVTLRIFYKASAPTMVRDRRAGRNRPDNTRGSMISPLDARCRIAYHRPLEERG